MSARRSLLPILLTIAGITLAPPASSLAECLIVSRWPSFTDAAPSARRIILGTVVAGQSNATDHFVLRVDDELRGEAQDMIEFLRFRSLAPTPQCPAESVLRAKVGDHLAIAYGARMKGLDHRIRAVAFVSPSAPDSLMRGAEQLDLIELYRIAGQDLSLLEQVILSIKYDILSAVDALMLATTAALQATPPPG